MTKELENDIKETQESINAHEHELAVLKNILKLQLSSLFCQDRDINIKKDILIINKGGTSQAKIMCIY